MYRIYLINIRDEYRLLKISEFFLLNYVKKMKYLRGQKV
ncbi:hypothetical protein BV454_00447 [Bacillus altitudinis]|nr:hypothetical protein [Bacillus altitudinis]